MKIVQRGNRQLQVEDARLQEMLDAGYVEIDPKKGKPVSPPKAPGGETKELKAAVKELEKQVEDLTAERDALKAQLESASSGSEGPKEPDPPKES